MHYNPKQTDSIPTAIGAMTHEELDAELAAGVESLKTGRVLTADEFDAELDLSKAPANIDMSQMKDEEIHAMLDRGYQEAMAGKTRDVKEAFETFRAEKQSAAADAMKTLGQHMQGEAIKTEITTEDDVVDLVKSVRREDSKDA